MLHEDTWDELKNFKRSIYTPFIIHGESQYILKFSTDSNSDGSDTKKHQDHTGCSYGYKLICNDEQYNKPYKTYFLKDAIGKFINMFNESEYCR